MPKLLNVEKLDKKFASLTKSRDSIQGLSAWIIHHKEFYKEIVEQWLVGLSKDFNALVMFYVANEVIQNCGKKRVPEFREAFSKVLDKAVCLEKVKEIKSEVCRLIAIWRERDIYDEIFSKRLEEKLNSTEVKALSEEEEISECEIIARYKQEDLISDLRRLQVLETEMKEKEEILNYADEPEMPESDDLIVRREVQQMLKKFDAFHNLVDKSLNLATEELALRKNVLEELKYSCVFHSAQNSDVKKVANAYSAYGKKLKVMEKRLSEKKLTLPVPVVKNSPCFSDENMSSSPSVAISPYDFEAASSTPKEISKLSLSPNSEPSQNSASFLEKKSKETIVSDTSCNVGKLSSKTFLPTLNAPEVAISNKNLELLTNKEAKKTEKSENTKSHLNDESKSFLDLQKQLSQLSQQKNSLPLDFQTCTSEEKSKLFLGLLEIPFIKTDASTSKSGHISSRHSNQKTSTTDQTISSESQQPISSTQQTINQRQHEYTAQKQDALIQKQNIPTSKKQTSSQNLETSTLVQQAGTTKHQAGTLKQHAVSNQQAESSLQKASSPAQHLNTLTLNHQAGIPKNQAGTPKNQESTPKQQAVSNEQTVSKMKQAGFPIQQASPSKQTETLKQQTSTAKQQVDALKKLAETPKQQTGTPKQQTGTPKQQIGTPKQQTGTPKQQSGTPKQQIGTPKQQTATPKQQTGTPKQAGTPKQKTDIPKLQTDTMKERTVILKQQVDIPNQQIHILNESNKTSTKESFTASNLQLLRTADKQPGKMSSDKQTKAISNLATQNSEGYLFEVDHLLEKSYDHKKSKSSISYKRKIEFLLNSRGKKPCNESAVGDAAKTHLSKDSGNEKNLAMDAQASCVNTAHNTITEISIMQSEMESCIESMPESKLISGNEKSAPVESELSAPIHGMQSTETRESLTLDQKIKKISDLVVSSAGTHLEGENLPASTTQSFIGSVVDSGVHGNSPITTTGSFAIPGLCSYLSDISTDFLKDILGKQSSIPEIPENNFTETNVNSEFKNVLSLKQIDPITENQLKGDPDVLGSQSIPPEETLPETESKLESLVKDTLFHSKDSSEVTVSSISPSRKVSTIENDTDTCTNHSLKSTSELKKENDHMRSNETLDSFLTYKKIDERPLMKDNNQCEETSNTDDQNRTIILNEFSNPIPGEQVVDNQKANFLRTLQNLLQSISTKTVSSLGAKDLQCKGVRLEPPMPFENCLRIYNALYYNKETPIDLKDSVLDAEISINGCIDTKKDVPNSCIQDNLEVMDMECDSEDEYLVS